MKCENCNLDHSRIYGSGRFCSSKCARSFSTKNKRTEINEKVSQSLTGRESPFKGIKRGKYRTKARIIDSSIKQTKNEEEKGRYNSYMKTYMLKLYHNKRNKIIEYLGGKCIRCGSTSNLQIDHINHTSKKFGLAKWWSYKWEILKKELDKCQLLCKEHHLDKTKLEGSLTKAWTTKPRFIHGSVWTYTHHKCRCEICIEGYKQYKFRRKL